MRHDQQVAASNAALHGAQQAFVQQLAQFPGLATALFDGLHKLADIVCQPIAVQLKNTDFRTCQGVAIQGTARRKEAHQGFLWPQPRRHPLHADAA